MNTSRINWLGIGVLALVMALVLGFGIGDRMVMAQETDESTVDENIPPQPRRPLAGFRWNGSATFDGVDQLTCAGITASIVGQDTEIGRPTLIIGTGGEETTIDALDLSQVNVDIIATQDGQLVVARICQGPTLNIRGKIEAVDAENGTLTVNGVTVQVTEYTRIGLPRMAWSDDTAPSIEDLEVDMPVHVVTQYANGSYLALVIRGMHGKIQGPGQGPQPGSGQMQRPVPDSMDVAGPQAGMGRGRNS